MAWVTRLSLVSLLLLLASVARADDASPAQEPFLEGTRQLERGDYQAALASFRRAYLVGEDPAHLKQIAQCQRRLGRNVEAVQLYRLYLERVPQAPDRADVEARIAEIGGAAALPPAPRAARSAFDELVPQLPEEVSPIIKRAPTPFYSRWWLWTAVGVVVAVGSGAAIGYGFQEANRRHGTLGDWNLALVRF